MIFVFPGKDLCFVKTRIRVAVPLWVNTAKPLNLSGFFLAGSDHYVQSSLLADLVKSWADWKDAPEL